MQKKCSAPHKPSKISQAIFKQRGFYFSLYHSIDRPYIPRFLQTTLKTSKAVTCEKLHVVTVNFFVSQYIINKHDNFYVIYFTNVLSHWDFFHGKFGSLSPGKASCDRVALPNLRCTLGVLEFP